MKTNKSAWKIIARRELSAYFTSPAAYIVCVLFLLFSGFMFFSTFFLYARAELRNFFRYLPLLFSVFIPALTMRSLSEENRSGSIETLLTLPVTVGEIVAGKFIAAFLSVIVMLIPTLSFALACYILGSPDSGPIIGGYLGAIFLASSYTAIGLFASSLSKNQIISFLLASSVCLVLSLLDSMIVLFPGNVANVISFICSGSHFTSISRGVLDSRDILYFVSITAIFCALTVHGISRSRKG